MFLGLLLISLGIQCLDQNSRDPALQYEPSGVLSFVEKLKSLPPNPINSERDTSVIENFFDSNQIYRGNIIRKLDSNNKWQIEAISVEFKYMRVTSANLTSESLQCGNCQYARDWGEAYFYWSRQRGQAFEAYFHPETEMIFSDCRIKKPAEFSHSIKNEALLSSSFADKTQAQILTTQISQKKIEPKLDSPAESNCIKYQRDESGNFVVSKRCQPTDKAEDFWSDLSVEENFRQ